MLYTQTVAAATLGLLKQLQSEPALGTSCLTGVMALSLHLGHRPCREAEFLLPEVFNWELLEELLRDKYGFRGGVSNNALRGRIGGTEIYLREQVHTLVSRPVEESGLRLCGVGDLAARTLSELETDGSREAPFADLACLSVRLSLDDMLACYERKYPSRNVVGAIKALLYFEEIEHCKEAFSMPDYDYTWAATAERIRKMADAPDRVFAAYPFPQREKPRTEPEPSGAQRRRRTRSNAPSRNKPDRG